MDAAQIVKRLLWAFVPSSSAFLYKICKRYVNQYDAENNSDPYTNGEYWFLESVIPKCAVVFDVGANIGDWAARAVSINPNVKVHSFEPSKQTFQCLRVRALDNVICNNCGLSSETGETTLYVFSEGAGTNSLYCRRGLGDARQKDEEKIYLNTIDNYCQDLGLGHIDLLKVDVEGHELDVFRGGRELLQRKRIRRIQFEYGGCNIDSRTLLRDLFDFFEPYGYVFYKLYPNRLQEVPRYNQRLETYQYQNWILLSKECASTLGKDN